MVNIQPIQPKFNLQVLDPEQVEAIKTATLDVLERVGVHVPSARALRVLAEHGAQVDAARQIARLPADLVLTAMSHAPRSFTLAGRTVGADLLLDGQRCYFGTDGCGTETIDFTTGERHSSSKDDVALMARVADALPSVSFYWPMVSAQDYGRLAPLHELDASFNNTSKHVQTETVMGKTPAQYAVRMGEVIAGSREQMRARPPFSVLICTIAPLGQDDHGIEGAMVYAEAGIPVGFMSMPTIGSTAPATAGGALVEGNAEVVSAMVLMQLVAPGAPVYHSLLASVMDPYSADYIVSIPQKFICNAAAVQLAHSWGVPSLAGAFGMNSPEPDTWQLGRDSVFTTLMVALSGADMVTGGGMLDASTLLLPEQIIYDDEVYHMVRRLAEGVDTSSDGLALDVLSAVGPRSHFLAQEHTRRHMRQIWVPPLSHPRATAKQTPPAEIRQRARNEFARILTEYCPDPLDRAVQVELQAILDAAAREIT